MVVEPVPAGIVAARNPLVCAPREEAARIRSGVGLETDFHFQARSDQHRAQRRVPAKRRHGDRDHPQEAQGTFRAEGCPGCRIRFGELAGIDAAHLLLHGETIRPLDDGTGGSGLRRVARPRKRRQHADRKHRPRAGRHRQVEAGDGQLGGSRLPSPGPTFHRPGGLAVRHRHNGRHGSGDLHEHALGIGAHDPHAGRAGNAGGSNIAGDQPRPTEEHPQPRSEGRGPRYRSSMPLQRLSLLVCGRRRADCRGIQLGRARSGLPGACQPPSRSRRQA